MDLKKLFGDKEDVSKDLNKVYKYVYTCSCGKVYGSDKIDNSGKCPLHDQKGKRFKK